MIKDITYSVTFPTNGLSLKGQLTPPPGITAVTGRNGSGKSFSASELPRYLLFGKKALRGPASDYKKLDATMDFQIRGEDYRVERNRKSERLLDKNDAVLAVGADAVNQKIRELLGFGLDVFDIACAVTQKQSERLTSMKPAERKKLIDQVLGLAANEVVERACRDEAKGYRREADAMSTMLSAPAEPVEPEGYRPSDQIAVDLLFVRERLKEKNALERIIAEVGPPPMLMAEPTGDLCALEAHEKSRLELDAQRRQLAKAIDAIPDAIWTAENLDAAETANQYHAEVKRRGPQPILPYGEVIAAIEAWAHYGAVKNLVHVEATCPKCDHIFLTNGEVPEPPTTPLPELRAEQRRHDNWSSPLPPEPAGGMTMTDAEIQKGRIALARVNEKLKLIDELAGLPILEDRSDTLAGERRLRAEWAAYVVAKEGWEKRSAAAVEAKAALEQLGEVIDNTHELEAALLNARVYENQVEAYAKARAEFDRISLEITEKVRKADAYKHGAEALVSARTTVKAYLAPALTRVASTLIHQMTNGVFSSVIVDEEMNISVDGQAVETLSGAGATVANVALRVALGQVLVSRVFPVFLADELDSDMDAERSQATIESLANLREQIGQLIIITHKRLGETLMIPGEYHHVDLDNSQPTT